MNNILEVINLSKTFDNKPIISNLSFTMEKGDVFSIMGKSGIGKTTLLRMITGLEIPDSGEILINDKIVNSDKNFIEPYKRDIGFVFQNSVLWPHMTMNENILFAVSDEYKLKMKEIISISGIEEIMNKYPNEVSEGEGKRVSIARAICSGAKILIMDEPFANLDDEIKYQLINMIKDIHSKTGISILIVSHNIEENIKLSDRIFELIDGGLYEKKI
ncbi:MAG: ATP-binding cassette domain-containing protein [Bacillota bacterium]|nr:ATP-binding cassette domain-containing protein [Bacillota bacterium]